MNHYLRFVLAVSFVGLFAAELCAAQGPQSKEKLMEQARQEYVAGKFADAERDLAGGPGKWGCPRRAGFARLGSYCHFARRARIHSGGNTALTATIPFSLKA